MYENYYRFVDHLKKAITTVATSWTRYELLLLPSDVFVRTPPPLDHVMTVLGAAGNLAWDVYRARRWVDVQGWTVWNDPKRRSVAESFIKEIDVAVCDVSLSSTGSK